MFLFHTILQAANPSKLVFEKDHFTISQSRSEETLPLHTDAPAPAKSVEFRRNDEYVVWDDRGLTVRVQRTSFSTKFKEVPVSPRLRARTDILSTIDAVHQQGRRLEANGLSGSRRYGPDVFLLVRWQDRPTVNWLEALIKIDMTQSNPRPETVAVLPGTTFSSRPVEDNLQIRGKRLTAYIHSGSNWGKWTYDLATSEVVFTSIGTGVKYVKPLPDGSVSFIEKTDYGTSLAGLLDASDGTRMVEEESEDPIKFLDDQQPPIAYAKTNDGVKVWNLTTGSVCTLPADTSLMRSKAGVLAWIGLDKPSKAWLYDPTVWNPLAWWKKDLRSSLSNF